MGARGEDLKAETLSAFALASTAVTAGGSGDNTEVVGVTIDIGSLAERPNSVSFEVPFVATLAATQTGVVTGLIQQSVDGTTWTTLVASATLLTLTGPSGGGTVRGVARIGSSLLKKDCNYIRVKATPNLSAANTDTAVLGAGVAVFGGLAAA